MKILHFKKDKFTQYILKNGGEILPESNEYEAIRFKGSRVGVIYTSGKTSGEYAYDAYQDFLQNKAWRDKASTTARKLNYSKEKKQILKRDGCNCFYCLQPLGKDMTLEHLIPLTAGGQNVLGNMVLAHLACNRKAGVKSIVDKMRIREQNLVKMMSRKSGKKDGLSKGGQAWNYIARNWPNVSYKDFNNTLVSIFQ